MNYYFKISDKCYTLVEYIYGRNNLSMAFKKHLFNFSYV